MNDLSYSLLFERILGEFKDDFPLILDAIHKSPDGPVVEMGSGTGRLLNLPEVGRPLILVEKDQDMLCVLKSKLKATAHHVQVVECDVVSCQLPSEMAGTVVFAANTLAEIGPIFFALSEAVRVLKPGGLVHMVVSNPKNPGRDPEGLKPGPQGPWEPFCYSYDLFPQSSQLSSDRGNVYTMQMRGKNSRETFVYNITQTLLTADEWLRQFKLLSLEVVDFWGSFDGSPFHEHQSEIMVFNLRKTLSMTGHGGSFLGEVYDRLAPQYDQKMLDAGYTGAQWLQRVSHRFERCHVDVLDLGCGTGLVGKTLESAGVLAKIYGLDFSRKMLEYAALRNSYHATAQFDLNQDLPVYEQKFFDLITAIGVLEFVVDLRKLILQATPLLNLGGELWFTLEVSHQEDIAINTSQKGIEKRSYSLEYCKKVLAEACLDLISVEQMFGHRSFTYNEDIEYFYIRATRKRSL